MIRVNLLQLKRKKKKKPLPAFVILAVLLLVVTVLIAGFIYMNQIKKIDSLKLTKSRNMARIAELKKKVKEVDDFEAKIRQFEERKRVITTLRKNQSVPVRMLNELSTRIAEGVWFKGLEVKNDQVNLKGFAFTNSNVVELVNNMKKSRLFYDVYLAESKEAKVGKAKVYQFKLKFRLKV